MLGRLGILLIALIAANPASAQSRRFDKTGVMRCTTTDNWVVQGGYSPDTARAVQSRNRVPQTYVFNLKRRTIGLGGMHFPIKVVSDNPLGMVVVSGGITTYSIKEGEFTSTEIMSGNVEVTYGTCVRERKR